MDWLLVALFAAMFTSLSTIFAKVGIKSVNSNFGTAYRTFIVIICCLIVCTISGNIYYIDKINNNGLLFLILSGIATGASWLCYYRALKLSNVNKVAPIDKSSFVLTNILFLIFFFDVTTKDGDSLTILMLIVSMILMLVGTIFMTSDNQTNESSDKKWLLYAILSAVFASIVALLVKIGLKNIPSDLATLIRTIVVFIISIFIVFLKKDYKEIEKTSVKTWIFLTLSALATGGAWLCEYEAFGNANANPVVINSIGKLSILLTMAFSSFLLKEKFNKKSLLGLFIMTIGIAVAVLFGL